MTRGSRAVLTSAAWCALGGPVVGVVTLYAVRLWLPATGSDLQPNVEAAPLLVSLGIYLTYAAIVVGPLSAGLGAAGAWLLVRERRRTHARGWIYASGLALGMLGGLACLPAVLTAITLPFAASSGRWREHFAGFIPMLLPSHPYAAAGLITGGLLGSLVAFIVDRRLSEAALAS